MLKKEDKYQEKGSYALVNGLNMYYEIHGTGKPLVLIHGAFGSIKTNFGNILPAFAETKQVIAVELQGHGHTADIDRQFTFEQMADDVAALLRYLGIENADFFGYSMGGDVSVQVALRHPVLVHKIVFAGGASYHPDSFYSEVLEKMMKPGKLWKEYYDSIAPNPSDFPMLVEKIKEMILAWKGVPPEDLKAIKAPALLVIGDSDIVRPEHVVRMFRLLGGGVPGDLVGISNSRLAVLPGTTHSSLIDRTDWLFSMIMEFLDAPMPKENFYN
ncbi:MAG: alpha/beta fold hydrolase [Methanobacterium sp.]